MISISEKKLTKLTNILSPCILALTFCLIAFIISLVDFISGEAFADVAFFTYLILSIIIFLIDLGTKKLTKYRKVYFWPLQTALLIGLFFLIRSVVGGMFSAGL